MSEEKKVQKDDDLHLGCLFALLACFAIVIIICVIDYQNQEVSKSTVYAFIGGVIFSAAVLIQIIVKIIKANSKK